MDKFNNYLTTLIDNGSDAQSNLYEAVFTFGTNSPNIDNEELNTMMSVRCQGFNQPQITQDSYQVRYITAFIDRPRTAVRVNRNFTLTFRSDDNWLLYESLLKQKRLTSSESESFANSDIQSLRDKNVLFSVGINILNEAESVDSDNNVKRLYTFKDCWIESITPPAFNNGNSNPIEVTASINFLFMEDWQTGISEDDYHPDSMIKDVINVKAYK